MITQARLQSLEKKMDVAFEAIGVDGSLVGPGKESPALMTGKGNPPSMAGEEYVFKLDEE